jgi:hypothetical protein
VISRPYREVCGLAERADNIPEPVDVRIYEGKTAHGVQLLDNPEVKPDIRDWLTANLPLSSGE